jgi:hypothetical protein
MIPPEIMHRIIHAIHEHVERDSPDPELKKPFTSLVEGLSCPYCDRRSLELLNYRHFHLLASRVSGAFLESGCIVRCSHCGNFMIHNHDSRCEICPLQVECFNSALGQILHKRFNFLILAEKEDS